VSSFGSILAAGHRNTEFTMHTHQTAIESTFDIWRHMMTEFEEPTAEITDDDLNMACGLINVLETDALEAPPASVLDLCR
jgi:hypothetical protein